jgi:hypothetical protein
MLVKCIAEKPNDMQVQTLGECYKKSGVNQDSHLTVGKTYLALGLLLNDSYPHMGRGSWVTIQCDYGHITSYPIVLFEVIDGRVDLEWVVRSRPDGIVEVEPELLHQKHFMEGFLDGVPEAVKAFKELLRRMEQRAMVVSGTSDRPC